MTASTVEELYQREQELAEEHAALGKEVRTLTSDAGALLLDQPQVLAGTTKRLQEVQTRSQLVLSAIAEVRKRRTLAIQAEYAARAAAKRAEAEAKRTEAETMLVRTRELLQALLEHEGARYVPYTPPRLVQGTSYGSDGMGAFTIPRSTLLRNQADELEQQARAVEHEKVPDGGELHTATLESLLRQVRALGAYRLSPSGPDLAAWIAAGTPTQKPWPARRIIITAYNLTWRRGVIDTTRSTIESREARDDEHAQKLVAAIQE